MASPGVALDTFLLTMVNFYSQFKATPHKAPVNFSTILKKSPQMYCLPSMGQINEYEHLNSRLMKMSYWPDLGLPSP